MSFTATCPECGAKQRRADNVRGRSVSCSECGADYTARPAPKKPSGNGMTYLVLSLLGLLVLGAGVVLLILVMRKSPESQAAGPADASLAAAPVPPFKPALPGGKPQPAPAASDEMAITLTGDVFRQQFARDPDGVEGRYRHQALEITGTISSLQDLAPIRGVILGNPQDPAPPILCDLAPDQAAAFAKLKPGQKVTIRGVFQGKMAEGFLGLSKCRVVEK